ncbi:PREDICTED: uncharacterized protein LOC104825742 [Tarenaya hassleriana]|uniref:uncharacterized protein LOC104825742 n=1 Tax=Tarenaya hassleriana TaxID=28532 RepID=UPI00053C8830|nr:PREDICTED: uncharacterized protein LOC104825742 [Tarenaya hassleriana]
MAEEALRGDNAQRGQPQEAPRTLRTYTQPKHTQLLSCINKDPLEDFELQPQCIQMLNNMSFRGRPNEDPNAHLTNFKMNCKAIKKGPGITTDDVLLEAFPYSLMERARDWLYTLEPNSISSWDEMEEQFLMQYYSPTKTQHARNRINSFVQEDGENLHDAWERFKEYQRMCPHHGMERDYLLSIFIHGLKDDTRSWIDAACGGDIYDIPFQELEATIAKLAKGRSHTSNEFSRKSSTKGDIGENIALKAVLSQLEEIKLHLAGNKQVAAIEEHGSTQIQPGMYLVDQGVEEANYVGPNQFNHPSNLYHPGLRNHPNFSYKNPTNALNTQSGFQRNNQGPPGFQSKFQQQSQDNQGYQGTSNFRMQQSQSKEQDPEIKDMLMQILQGQKSQGISIGNIEAEQVAFKKQMDGVHAHLKILDNQVAQLASSSSSRQQGTLPGKNETNPREHINAVELRSGKQLPEITPPMAERGPTPRLTREEKGKAIEESTPKVAEQEKEPVYIPPPPKIEPYAILEQA